MRGHLASAGTGVIGRPDRLQEHVLRLGPERQTKRTIAGVGIETVIASPERGTGSHADSFVSGPRHLKKDFLLAFEQDFPVVNPPGRVHDAVSFDQLLAGKPLVGLPCPFKFFVRRGQLGISLGCCHPVPQAPTYIVNRKSGFRIYWIHGSAGSKGQGCKVPRFQSLRCTARFKSHQPRIGCKIRAIGAIGQSEPSGNRSHLAIGAIWQSEPSFEAHHRWNFENVRLRNVSVIKFNRRFETQKIRLLIFDLDGTLIDSRLDLVNSINAMLRRFKRPELPGEVIAAYVGDGAPMLVRRALGDPKNEAFLKEALEYFLAYYRVHKLDHTHIYDGVRETLEALRSSQNGLRRQMAVLSNKPVNPSRAIPEALGVG